MGTIAGKVRITHRGVWSSTQSYEILDVVSNVGSTAVYMAKRDVPAGTAVTNGSYWDKFMTVEAAVAAANAAIQRADTAATNANNAAADARAAAIELSDEFKGVVDKLTTPFTETAPIIQCNPVEGYPLDVTVDLEPIQPGSGDPYPAGCGKNLFEAPDVETVSSLYGITCTRKIDGSVVLNGTCEGTTAGFIIPLGKIIPAGTTFSISMNNPTAVSNGTSAVDNVVGIRATNMLTHVDGIKYDYVNIVKSNTVNAVLTSKFISSSGEEIDTVAVQIRVPVGLSLDNFTMKPQVEIGQPTEYAPYSNIRPISGHTGGTVTRCGKNLLKNIWQSQIYYGVVMTVGADGSITATGTATATANTQRVFNDITVPGSYILSIGAKYNESFRLVFKIVRSSGEIEWGGVVDELKITLAQGDCIESIYIAIQADAVLNNYTMYPMLRLSAADMTYEPYQGDTYTTELGQTVYGGDLSWNTGVLTVTHKLHTIDKNTNLHDVSVRTNTIRFTVYLPSNAVDNAATQQVITDTVPFKLYVYTDTNDIPGAYILAGYPTTLVLSLPVDVYGTTIESIRAALALRPIQVCYKLATPTTITVPAHTIPALDGVNTVYSDAGSVTVSGATDPDYLNKNMLERIAALEAAAVNHI